MSQPAIAFSENLPRRRRMPIPTDIRKVCLCDSCCAAFPARAKERRRQQREVRQRFGVVRQERDL